MQPSVLLKAGMLSSLARVTQALNICMAEESLGPSFPGNGGASNVGWQFWPPGEFAPCDAGSHEGPDSKNGELKDQLPYYFELCDGQGFTLHWDDNTHYNVRLERNGEFYEPVASDELCDYHGHDCFARNFFGRAYWPDVPFACN